MCNAKLFYYSNFKIISMSSYRIQQNVNTAKLRFKAILYVKGEDNYLLYNMNVYSLNTAWGFKDKDLDMLVPFVIESYSSSLYLSISKVHILKKYVFSFYSLEHCSQNKQERKVLIS